MKYKNYTAKVTYDDEAEIFHGEVLDINGVVTFQGKNVDSLKKALKDSVDDYLEFCKEKNIQPEKKFSGKFMLRIPSSLHNEIYNLSSKSNKSINAWITEKLETIAKK